MSEDEDTTLEPLIQKPTTALKKKVPIAVSLPRKEVSFAKDPPTPQAPPEPPLHTKIPRTPTDIVPVNCKVHPQTCMCQAFQKDGVEYHKLVTICTLDVPALILENHMTSTTFMTTKGIHRLRSQIVVPANFTGVHKAHWRQRLSKKHKLILHGYVINNVVDGHCVSVEFLASDTHLTEYNA